MSRSIRIALLPLENLSGLARDGRLARGFAQDVIGELASFPALAVVAADSVNAAAGLAADPAALARKLDLAYLVRGSVRRQGKSLRFSLQLVEAASGEHLWAGRYDDTDLPGLQEEIAVRVANALALEVDRTQASRARRRPPVQLEAYDCWLLGMEAIQRGNPLADKEARELFCKSLEIDPQFARAHSGLSLACFNDWSCQAWDRWEETEAEAYRHALNAESLDPHDATIQVILARIEQYRRQFDHASPRLGRCALLAPNDARILAHLILCHAFDGNPSASLEAAQRAIELNPLCPGWYHALAGTPHLLLGRFREALQQMERATPGQIVDTPAYQAAAHGWLGESEAAAERLRQFRGDFRPRPFHLKEWRWTMRMGIEGFRDDCSMSSGQES